MKRKTLTAGVMAIFATTLVSAASIGTSSAASADLKISEFRVRGASGANDEFVEIYNPTANLVTVSVDDGSAGWSVVASDGTTRFTIPNGTVIPGRGHFLGVNSVGYGLSLYPAGNATTATGDATYTTDIPDNAGIAIFRTSNPANFTLANRSDAVGSEAEANALYKEGAGYPTLTPFSIDYSFARNEISGLAADTDDNAADFLFYDTNGTSAGAGQRLGAPGPQNLTSPVQMNSLLPMSVVDPDVGPYEGANMVRDFTSDPANNSTFGTISLRRTVTNNTGGPVTRLRVGTAFVNTFPSPSGVADLRGRTSVAVVVPLDAGGFANVAGTTLEQPPGQPNGSGFNATMSADTVTLGTPLTVGSSINLQFLFGIQQTGSFDITFNVEALPGGGFNAPGSSLSCSTEGCVVNSAPVAVNDVASTDEDTPIDVLAPGVLGNDTDVDGDGLTAVLDTNASNGDVILSANGSYSYTPDPDFHGSDQFTYHANDGTVDSNVVTVSITVDPANDAPVATADAYSVDEDSVLGVVAASGVLVNDADIDGNSITAVLDTDVAHGSLTLNADGSFTYTPDANFNGTDSFTYHASDATASSNIVTVSLTVDPVNDAPVVQDDAFSVTATSGAVTVNVLGNDSDPDGDSLTVTSFTNGAHGAVTCSGVNCTYQPDGDWTGPDSFTYTVSDGNGLTRTGTVAVQVLANVTFNTTTGTLPVTGSDPFGLVVLGAGLLGLGFVVLQGRRLLARR